MPRNAPSPGPEAASLAQARDLAAACRRCDLWRIGTQTVFGEGPAPAALLLVGEQPGDREDLAGRPFVGPAGALLDRALEEAGIDRAKVYVTNAVKHFKHVPRGKRRLHQRPDSGEIEACRWWLTLEQRFTQPKATVALGATAARALFGRSLAIGRSRGRALELPGGGSAFVTVHPSFVLRQRDEAARTTTFRTLVEDLRLAAAAL